MLQTLENSITNHVYNCGGGSGSGSIAGFSISSFINPKPPVFQELQMNLACNSDDKCVDSLVGIHIGNGTSQLSSVTTTRTCNRSFDVGQHTVYRNAHKCPKAHLSVNTQGSDITKPSDKSPSSPIKLNGKLTEQEITGPCYERQAVVEPEYCRITVPFESKSNSFQYVSEHASRNLELGGKKGETSQTDHPKPEPLNRQPKYVTCSDSKSSPEEEHDASNEGTETQCHLSNLCGSARLADSLKPTTCQPELVLNQHKDPSPCSNLSLNSFTNNHKTLNNIKKINVNPLPEDAGKSANRHDNVISKPNLFDDHTLNVAGSTNQILHHQWDQTETPKEEYADKCTETIKMTTDHEDLAEHPDYHSDLKGSEQIPVYSLCDEQPGKALNTPNALESPSEMMCPDEKDMLNSTPETIKNTHQYVTTSDLLAPPKLSKSESFNKDKMIVTANQKQLSSGENDAVKNGETVVDEEKGNSKKLTKVYRLESKKKNSKGLKKNIVRGISIGRKRNIKYTSAFKDYVAQRWGMMRPKLRTKDLCKCKVQSNGTSAKKGDTKVRRYCNSEVKHTAQKSNCNTQNQSFQAVFEGFTKQKEYSPTKLPTRKVTNGTMKNKDCNRSYKPAISYDYVAHELTKMQSCQVLLHDLKCVDKSELIKY